MKIDEVVREIQERGVKLDEFGPAELQLVADTFGIDMADPAKVRELTAAESAVETLHSEIEAARADVARMKREKLHAARDQFIRRAVDAGKILPKFAREWGRQYELDPDGTERLLGVPEADADTYAIPEPGFHVETLTVISR